MGTKRVFFQQDNEQHFLETYWNENGIIITSPSDYGGYHQDFEQIITVLDYETTGELIDELIRVREEYKNKMGA